MDGAAVPDPDGADHRGAARRGVARHGSAGHGGGGRTRGADGQPGRRQFLRVAAGASVAAAPLAGLLSACGGGPAGHPAAAQGASSRAASARASAPRPPGNADWVALRRRLSTQRLVQPGQPAYATAKQLFDPRFDRLSPAGIGYCATASDVSACLAFVREFGLPVAARSGGHSYAGWSSSTGLVVDVTAMNSLRLASAQTVQVGAGTRLIDLYNGLASHGVAVPGGSCPTVGVAGLTLGGGVGVLSRAYGLTSDNLTGLQVVTTDGAVRDCSAASHPDLLWACQGGGGGNFGIVTSFTFRTRPLSQLVVFFVSWPWPDAARVVAAWQDWAPVAPDELWSNLHLEASPGLPPTVQVGGTYLGSIAGCEQLLGQLYAAVGTRPASPFLEETSYQHAMMLEAGCAQLSAAQCHLPTQTPQGQLARQPSYASSDFYTARIPTAGIQALVTGVERMSSVAAPQTSVGAVAFDACGGAVNRVHPQATAYVHRDALFLAQYSTNWGTGASAAAVSRQQAWLDSVHAAMRPYVSGQAYQNYIDPALPGWQQAYYGANYPRLASIKATYDPDQVFRFPQGITPAG